MVLTHHGTEKFIGPKNQVSRSLFHFAKAHDLNAASSGISRKGALLEHCAWQTQEDSLGCEIGSLDPDVIDGRSSPASALRTGAPEVPFVYPFAICKQIAPTVATLRFIVL